MSNLAALLKQEITRLVRKQLKTDTDALRKASTRYRAEIAELKRRIGTLEAQFKAVSRQQRTTAPAVPSPESDSPRRRFRAEGFKQHRARLGLSAAAAAKLLGVSALTVYNWEAGKTQPRASQLEKIAHLRRLGKRDVQKYLASTEGSQA